MSWGTRIWPRIHWRWFIDDNIEKIGNLVRFHPRLSIRTTAELQELVKNAFGPIFFNLNIKNLTTMFVLALWTPLKMTNIYCFLRSVLQGTRFVSVEAVKETAAGVWMSKPKVKEMWMKSKSQCYTASVLLFICHTS